MSLPLWFVTVGLSLLGLLVGRVELRKALRGRRVGLAPVCAACGFNQTGRPSDSHRCSECGADLTAPHAIAIGHRRPRVGLAIFAGMLLFFGVYSGVESVLNFNRTDFRPILPLAWLEYRARHASPSGQADALTEMVDRWRRSRLSAAQHGELIELALAVQADPQQPWLQGWGELIELAKSAGDLSPEQWRRYAEHVSPIFTTIVRPKIAHDAELPYSIDLRSARAGSGGIMMHLPGRDRRVWIDDVPLPPPDPQYSGGVTFSLSARGGAGSASQIELPPAFRTVGKHHVRIRQHTTLTEQSNNEDSQSLAHAPAIDLEWSGDFELLPPGVSPVALVVDPGAANWVRMSIQVESIQLRPSPSVGWQRCSSTVHVTADITLPVDVGFDVIATHGGREWPLGKVAFRAGSDSSASYGSSVIDFPVDLNAVDVVFRPAPAAADGSMAIDSIWDGTFTQTNVKIIRK